MPEINFDPVDTIAAGAVGEPGHRTFFIQAQRGGQMLSVLVEKEQVAILSERMGHLLDQVAEQFPGEETPADPGSGLLEGDPVPLFRALAIGIGFDPGRRMVVLELHERAIEDNEDEGGDEDDGPSDEPPEAETGAPAVAGTEAEDSYLARLYLTPGQARAMASRGIEAVVAGRPPCPLCGGPLDPEGHVCPKLNGHGQPPA
ncbi:MAG: DUF3090 domain-containing protein [Acidimicrobiia bacterium]